MIINLRGTSGAGKSHLARRIMGEYQRDRKIYVTGRKKPYYSVHSHDDGRRKLAVLGHYEIKNGGVDTLPSLETAYQLAADLDLAYHVLMEGKCMSDGWRQPIKFLPNRKNLTVIRLTTPIELCIESVRARGHNIAPASIERTARKVDSDMKMLRSQGVRVFEGTRDECFDHAMELLR